MQNAESIRRHFKAIGARAKVRPLEFPEDEFQSDSFWIDVRSDRRGRYFDVEVGSLAPEIVVLQVCPKERHLLLYSRGGDRFLCGHDERDWFVAAVPARVSTVREAKQALMPADVWKEARRLHHSATNNRRNPVFVRQGAWVALTNITGMEIPFNALAPAPARRAAKGCIARRAQRGRTSRAGSPGRRCCERGGSHRARTAALRSSP